MLRCGSTLSPSDRGSSAGVALNMPVVTPGGIVGRVIAVSPWTAQVMLITDEKAAAGAIMGKLGESGALGSVRGLGTQGLVEMRYVSGLQKVEVGDYILTTGQDGIYPPGLNVGEVVEVKHGTATQHIKSMSSRALGWINWQRWRCCSINRRSGPHPNRLSRM